MATLAEQASKLLDFDQKLDITLLDSVVGCMYSGIGEQVRKAKTCTENVSHFTSLLNAQTQPRHFLIVVTILVTIQAGMGSQETCPFEAQVDILLLMRSCTFQ